MALLSQAKKLTKTLRYSPTMLDISIVNETSPEANWTDWQRTHRTTYWVRQGRKNAWIFLTPIFTLFSFLQGFQKEINKVDYIYPIKHVWNILKMATLFRIVLPGLLNHVQPIVCILFSFISNFGGDGRGRNGEIKDKLLL